MQDSEIKCANITESIESFYHHIQSSDEKNHVAIKRIFGTNDQVFMSLAKLDHIIWKINTYISILNNKPTFDFVDHHNCRLGKWYENGAGHEHFSHLASFRPLEIPHAEVHNNTKDIFNQLKSSANVNLEEIKSYVELMEKGSQGVFHYLDRILAEKNQIR